MGINLLTPKEREEYEQLTECLRRLKARLVCSGDNKKPWWCVIFGWEICFQRVGMKAVDIDEVREINHRLHNIGLLAQSRRDLTACGQRGQLARELLPEGLHKLDRLPMPT